VQNLNPVKKQRFEQTQWRSKYALSKENLAIGVSCNGNTK